jgi:tetratricopeptide (TPR) repeat protein
MCWLCRKRPRRPRNRVYYVGDRAIGINMKPMTPRPDGDIEPQYPRGGPSRASDEARLREALAVQRRRGDRAGEAATLRSLGTLALERGAYLAAKAHLGDALSIFRALGDRAGAADVLGTLATVALKQGRFDEAEDRFDEALRIRRALGGEASAGASGDG